LTLHDFLHVPGFTLITAALFFGFATGSRPRPPRPLHVLGVCVAALAVGIGIELAQAATVGSADPWDVVRDAGGIVSDVASAPRSRRLNLAQVKSVVLFAHNLEKPHELLVQELRLVP
jgi:hypothetical protein